MNCRLKQSKQRKSGKTGPSRAEHKTREALATVLLTEAKYHFQRDSVCVCVCVQYVGVGGRRLQYTNLPG